MDYTQINIAILPPQNIIQEAVSLSSSLSQRFKTEITLNTTHSFPHITLYQALYPSENIARLRESILKVVENIHPFELTLHTFNFSRKPFLFWECIKNESLQHLHESIVQVANPLRNGAIRNDVDLNALSPPDRYDMEHFGSLLIGPHYAPHITLSLLPQIEKEEKIYEIIGEKLEKTFIADKIIFGASGQYGTVREILQGFTLSV